MAEDRDHNLAGLSLEDKIALLSGASLWRTPALDSKGFRALKMSDGPHGVRGDGAVGGTRFPCGSVLGSTWDPELLEALGAALGREARAKAVSILLGPTINLQRTLLGGRNFEAYSEDPELTAALGEAFVRGVQSEGVAACPKHFVTNDCETERHSVSVEVDPQTLAECYLYPFERAVRVGGAWAIMA
ncbi:MAG: glycoside hydrolase family 3 N-terminal domain-containing protein, partial [Pseudomonadales bacterium]